MCVEGLTKINIILAICLIFVLDSLKLPRHKKTYMLRMAFRRLGGLGTKRLHVAVGVRCRKCFAGTGEAPNEQGNECIEQFD